MSQPQPPSALERMAKQETIALREKHIGRNCQLFFRKDPLKIVRAEKQYMYDEKGNAYLDCINNVAHVGHCRSEVVAAGAEQMALLSTNSRFLHDHLVLLAERVCRTLPQPLEVCFLVNSGSEANDLALRLAQTHTGRKDVITLEHAYHGHLTSLIDVSHYKFNLPGGTGLKDHVHVVPCPDVYRGRYRAVGTGEEVSEAEDEELGRRYAAHVLEACARSPTGVSAFIAESLQSCGGQIVPPRGYLRAAYAHVRAHGGLCIADEVQVGFGRVGRHWWAFQLQGEDVVPDIVTMGKPMGNGHPVAAVVTTREVADSFARTGVEYFNTYGGNPVSCAIANAVLDVLEREGLPGRAAAVGRRLLGACRQLQRRHDSIGDVRGVGLFVGIELVADRRARTPDAQLAAQVVSRMKHENILVSADGPDCNVIKLKPPMVFDNDNVDQFIQVLDRVLGEAVKAASEARKLELKHASAAAPDACMKSANISQRSEQQIKSI